MKLIRASAWADAVFHVLAHVDVPFASSCFSPAYRAWAASLIGPASARALAEDARVLAAVATSHEVFARAQAVAWVFDSADAARRAVDTELDGNAPIAEVLRAAAELELPLIEALPPLAFDVDAAIAAVLPAAPALAQHTIALTPALGLRGRVHDARIFVGVPGIAGATAMHVAWQAAHEATVSEVTSERRALGLLRSRARRVGLAVEHARWLAHLDSSAIGPVPDVDDAPE